MLRYIIHVTAGMELRCSDLLRKHAALDNELLAYAKDSVDGPI